MNRPYIKPIAIITGASSGIGEATAYRFAEYGYSVILVARSTELLQQLAEKINQRGGDAHVFTADLAEAKATSELVRYVVSQFGRVDVLVNNAGYGPPFTLEQMSRAKLLHVYNVNLLSGMQLISELTPLWRQQGYGRVVNVSSLTRYVGAPCAVAYAGTKAAMETMTAGLRLELAPWNIQLSCVIPGFIDTPTFEKSRQAGGDMLSDPKNVYRDWMHELDEFAKSQIKHAVSPVLVAEQIIKAATLKRPATRYYVPFSSRIAALLFSLLPDRIGDRLLLKMYGWGRQPIAQEQFS